MFYYSLHNFSGTVKETNRPEKWIMAHEMRKTHRTENRKVKHECFAYAILLVAKIHIDF